MTTQIEIAGRRLGEGQPCYIVAEIGINHNGDLEIALELIRAAAEAGCDAVKFQKRTPEVCVPDDQKSIPRETPWGLISYLEYRRRMELGREEFRAIDACCREHGIAWFASCWDEGSVDFIETFDPPCYKIASASLTDDDLLRHHRQYGRPILLSTGMSSLAEIDHAVEVLGRDALVLLHCTSTYPARVEELNLRAIASLRERYGVPVGYSGHEVGLATTVAAATLGAAVLERHITLDRSMWGSDQAASVEPQGFGRLARDVRAIEKALGDGVKRVYESEIPVRNKLRRVHGTKGASS